MKKKVEKSVYKILFWILLIILIATLIYFFVIKKEKITLESPRAAETYCDILLDQAKFYREECLNGNQVACRIWNQLYEAWLSQCIAIVPEAIETTDVPPY